MRKVTVFNFVTLDGYFEGPKKGDISWHRHGAEENEYAVEGVKSKSILLFGRVTYEMMASYWPTPMAMENDPIVAEGMNSAEKIVFSRTLEKAGWNNTRVVKNMVEEVKEMKQRAGKDMTLLGSGSIVTQLATQGLRISDHGGSRCHRRWHAHIQRHQAPAEPETYNDKNI